MTRSADLDRDKRLLELRAKGISLDQLAERFGTTAHVMSKWVAAAQRRSERQAQAEPGPMAEPG